MNIENILSDVTKKLYNRYFRKRFPHKVSIHNKVAVRDKIHIFDTTDTFPNYEQQLVSSIRQEVSRGDNVVIIGGGLGVSSVISSVYAGKNGKVTIYEGSGSQIEVVKNTLEMNETPAETCLIHGVVGEYLQHSEDLYGTPEQANVVDPTKLPETDVLELDCEGAELSIISQMEINPEIIIVETHGFLDIPPEQVKKQLKSMNYKIKAEDPLDPSRGIYIITAELE